MGLYYIKPEEKSLLYNRPIEEAFGIVEPKYEKPAEVPVNSEVSIFLRAALDGIMFASTGKKEK